MNVREIESDIAALRRSALVIRRRAFRQKGVWASVFCKVLTDLADRMQAERDREASALAAREAGMQTVIGWKL